MSPTLVTGDTILIFRFGNSLLKKGVIVLLNLDIVSSTLNETMVAEQHTEGENLYVKRLLALPGETVDIDPIWKDTIPAHHIFVVGDHAGSIDSRRWGPIPISSVKGIVIAKLPLFGK